MWNAVQFVIKQTSRNPQTENTAQLYMELETCGTSTAQESKSKSKFSISQTLEPLLFGYI